MVDVVTYTESVADDAAAALRLAFADPRRAQVGAQRALGAARAAGDAAAASTAEQALGVSARLQGDIRAALEHLRAAVSTAERANLAARAGEARLSLSLALAWAGHTEAALGALDEAAKVLHGAQLGQLRVQRAIILRRLGDVDGAADELRRAIPVVRRHGDTVWEARALCHRGLVHVERGAFAAGDADLSRAEALFASLGHVRDAAGNRHNRGWCAARAGDVPTALAHYDAADQQLAPLGLPMGERVLDRAQVLLSVGVAAEARDLAALAVERYADDRTGAAEARLTGAEAALASGDPVSARAGAAEARRWFRRQARPGWAALARHVEVRAAWAAGERSAALLRSACEVADELDRLGLPGPAADARLIAGRTASAIGRQLRAAELLAIAAASRNRGTADRRARAWLAEALRRLGEGRESAAQSAIRAGLRVLDEHRTSLGATDLRAHASTAGSELAALGLGLALRSGRPGQVLAWTERWRAGALRLRPVRPPGDVELAADLAALRKVTIHLEEGATTGRPTDSLLQRQAALEESVRRRARRTAGAGASADLSDRPPGVEEVRAALNGQVLVEITELEGQLHTVVVTPTACRLRQLGSAAEVAAEVDMVRFALRRMAHGRGSTGSLAAAAASAAHAGRRLDELLLAPLRRQIGDHPLVVVPPAGLHALPWPVLPSCRDRPLVVAPSAALWLRATRAAPPPGSRTVLVAGPGLPGADEEVAALARLLPSAATFAGATATSSAVCQALDGTVLAHVAAHGTFRSDNPLFSSLRMADGPITVYDLECLDRAPYRMVLSACDSGLASVRPGDEVMGLAAALLSLGTSGLVASVVPVDDGATTALMTALHRHLAGGATLAAALPAARADLGDGHQHAAAAVAFVCLGGSSA